MFVPFLFSPLLPSSLILSSLPFTYYYQLLVLYLIIVDRLLSPLAPNMASNPSYEMPIEAIVPTNSSDIEMVAQLPPEKTDSKLDDPFLVAFDEPFDPENPKNWPSGRKWAVTDVLSATGFNRIMVSTIMAPALPLISKEFDMSTTEPVMALSSRQPISLSFLYPLIVGQIPYIFWRTSLCAPLHNLYNANS